MQLERAESNLHYDHVIDISIIIMPTYQYPPPRAWIRGLYLCMHVREHNLLYVHA